MGNFELNGKTAVVTGAGQGLGKAFARALAEAGAEVFVMARNIERLKKTAEELAAATGSRVYAQALDITSEESIEKACRSVVEKSGKIDILINNAALGRSDAELQNETLETWNQIMNTNLTGTFLMMKHVGKVMIERGGGKIINLASMTGMVAVRNPSVGAYDVSKAGIACLTRIMAGAWSRYHITVNSISPGYYMTDINRAYVKDHPEFYEDSLKQIPLQKWGKEEDIGNIAVFLASSASDYMTGANIVTDGGYTVW